VKTKKILNNTDGLRKIINFRDCGGYNASGGKKVRLGMIYRSGQPDKANQQDIDIISALNLKTIIDLRPEKEWIRFHPALNKAERVHLQIDITQTTMKRLRKWLNKKHTENEIINAVDSVYADMVDLMKPHLKVLFKLLSNGNSYPILIHCRGGKDRTGVIVALIHSVLGVSFEDILKDYMFTNEYLLPPARKAMKKFKWMSFGLFPAENYEIAYAAREKYIHTFFEKIKVDFGSLDNYLAANEVSSSIMKEVKSILLENSVSGLHKV
jgi:protein-tyrosine phosphatase